MPLIDPSIMEHEIKNYPNAKPIRQNITPINPWKAAAIKTEVDKLLKASFIYLISLKEWVSNPILVHKKQGDINISTNLWYFNKTCPKDNYPMPFIDQIIDAYAGSEVFSLMDGFLVYN